MYAIVETGGQQFRVEEGSKLRVDLIEAEIGSEIQLDKVLMLGGEKFALGKPYVDGASIKAEVTDHVLGEKVISFKRKRRNDQRRTRGHRQRYTTLKIKAITA